VRRPKGADWGVRMIIFSVAPERERLCELSGRVAQKMTSRRHVRIGEECRQLRQVDEHFDARMGQEWVKNGMRMA
jgi:hypothetical protein